MADSVNVDDSYTRNLNDNLENVVFLARVLHGVFFGVGFHVGRNAIHFAS